jgi:hypothetical protein
MNLLYDKLNEDDLTCYLILYEIRKIIFDIELRVRDIASILFCVDIQKCLTEVHRSNMTKLCKSEEEAIATVENYKKNDTRYDTPSYRISSNPSYWTVFNQSTGKILKSINYEEPKLKQFCE